MYENNYPNNYNGANAESGSEASQSGSNAYYYEQPKPGAQKPKKQSGTGKKLVLGICCGLLFGIFAGLGFEAVTTASGVVKESLLTGQRALPQTRSHPLSRIGTGRIWCRPR